MNYLKIVRNNLGLLVRKYSKTPRLSAVAIEINSGCNRKCEWCPNSIASRPQNKLLEDTLFYNIIDQLVAMKFHGQITFNLFNEPLLDTRLATFIAYTRKHLPSSVIYLNTNGDILTLEMWTHLREQGMDYAKISQYDGQFNNNIRTVMERLDKNERKHFRAYIFKPSQINNRAGLIATTSKLPLKKFCSRPFYQLCITYEGKVVLCCNDYYGQVQIGDIRTNRIKDIWRNDIFVRYRKTLRKGNRGNLALCKTCDLLNL